MSKGYKNEEKRLAFLKIKCPLQQAFKKKNLTPCLLHRTDST
jgi:hypothetical protein